MAIKAGVVLVQDFCKPGSDVFSGYIDYINRDEATRNENMEAYNLFSEYNNYMDNPIKTSGLFTNDKDSLSLSEKNNLKNVFLQAQQNGSLMWQTVISFDNAWLEKNGLYDFRTHTADEYMLHEAVRSGIEEMLKAEGLAGATWSAAIHYNTDNVHIHIATVEPFPTRKQKEYDGKMEYVGKFKLQNIEKAKSKVVNKIMSSQKENQKINSIIRQNIMAAYRDESLLEDSEMREGFLRIYKALPEDRRTWMYNMNALKDIRPLIDAVNKQYIEKYHADDFKELQYNLKVQEMKYNEAYGQGQKREFKYVDNKIQDMYTRLGNTLLKQIKVYDEELQAFSEQGKVRELLEAVEDKVLDGEELEQDESVNLEPETSSSINSDDLPIGEFEDYSVDSHTNQYKKAGRGSGHSKNGIFMEWTKDYKTAKQLYNSQDPEKVIKGVNIYLKEAAKGNILAIYDVARIYEQGVGNEIKIDKIKAESYYEAAFNGFNQVYRGENWNDRSDDFGKFEKSFIEYRIGKMYDRGQGTDQDFEKAAKLYEQSGSEFAHYSLGKMYLEGRGVEQSNEAAYQEFLTAVDMGEGNAFAEWEIAKMLEKGQGIDQDIEKANQYYKRAFDDFMNIKNIDSNIKYRLGSMLENGKGVEKNLKEATEFYKEAAMTGNGYAKYKLFKIYSQSDNIDQEELEQSVIWLREAAKEGIDIAQYALGKELLEGTLLDKNESEGVEYLKLSSEQGNDYAMYTLGRYLVEKEDAEGLEYLKMSAEAGNQQGQYFLGNLYIEGKFVEKDVNKGEELLKLAIEQGNDQAMYKLGKHYLQDVEGKKKEGQYYLEMAAAAGNQYGQCYLGSLYCSGDILKKNTARGEMLLKLAADQGNDSAMYKLGKHYLEINNISSGLSYLQKAVENENQYAQCYLGILYYTGKYVRQDISVAKDLLNKSAAQGNEFAEQILKKGLSRSAGRFYLGSKIYRMVEKSMKQLKKSIDEEYNKTQRINMREYLKNEMDKG